MDWPEGELIDGTKQRFQVSWDELGLHALKLQVELGYIETEFCRETIIVESPKARRTLRNSYELRGR